MRVYCSFNTNLVFKLINSIEQLLKLFSAYLYVYVFSLDKDLRGATGSSKCGRRPTTGLRLQSVSLAAQCSARSRAQWGACATSHRSSGQLPAQIICRTTDPTNAALDLKATAITRPSDSCPVCSSSLSFIKRWCVSPAQHYRLCPWGSVWAPSYAGKWC